jgi:hypothetical protein
MPRYEHENFGDVQRYVFMKGIITSVDSENDTADVTIPGGSDGSDVPVFYHCSDEAEERSNGAIEGGSGAFNVDDEVICMCTVDGAPVRIIGFVDGIKSCMWEPWGETWCENQWWQNNYNNGDGLVYSRSCSLGNDIIPSPYVIFEDSVYTIDMTAPSNAATTGLLWQKTPDDSNTEDFTSLIVKANFTNTGFVQSSYDRAYIYIEVSNKEETVFEEAYLHFYLTDNPSTPGANTYFIDEFNGTPVTLLLSDYGITIEEMRLSYFLIYIVASQGGGQIFNLAIDYINFT